MVLSRSVVLSWSVALSWSVGRSCPAERGRGSAAERCRCVPALPTVSGLLTTSQEGYRDLQPWVDLNYAQSFLFQGTLTGEQWAHLAVTVAIWLVLPALVALRLVRRSEVK